MYFGGLAVAAAVIVFLLAFVFKPAEVLNSVGLSGLVVKNAAGGSLNQSGKVRNYLGGTAGAASQPAGGVKQGSQFDTSNVGNTDDLIKGKQIVPAK